MEFFDNLTSAIPDKYTVKKVSPFSYFIQSKQLKIHFVQIERYNATIYQNKIQNLEEKKGHFTTVFEDVFKSNPKKLMERLKYHGGKSYRIHGRETVVKKITKLEAIEFLEKNHGNIPLKTKYSFGLLNKRKQLVAIACFGQVIRMRNGAKSSELIRFCSLSGSRVVGGLTKLIGHFKTLHQLDELMTYCDLEWSNGENFEKLGFENIETSNPIEFVVNLSSWERMYISKFKKSVDFFDTNRSVFRKVLNRGSIKFIKYFNEK